MAPGASRGPPARVRALTADGPAAPRVRGWSGPCRDGRPVNPDRLSEGPDRVARARRPLMALAPRLLVTHMAPVLLLLVGLAATVAGLARMTRAIAEVRDRHLSTLDAEERLHRAAWDVEVAARHGHDACGAGTADAAAIHGALGAARRRLHGLHQSAAGRFPPQLRVTAARYLAHADALLAAPSVCAALLSPESVRLRTVLDEEMTEVWIARLREVHAAIEQREEETRRIGAWTTVAGVVMALAGLAAAGLVALATARQVTAPLARLARAASRLGEGEFTHVAVASGPRELAELSLALERSQRRLLELDQLKQGFIASVSHELRTPLAKLREALALLADGTTGPLTRAQARVVELATRACEREVKIVSALLDLSRIRSGGALLRQTGCAVDAVLARAVDDEASAADEAGVRIERLAGEDVPPLWIDAVLIERAVANLLRNAVSVSAAGQTVRLSRRLHAGGPDGAAGRWLEVRVADEGPGVPEAARATLFESFASRPVASRAAGVGLGLAVTREVLRAHGGDARYVEAPGPGATFTLWLPLESKSPAAPPRSTPPPDARPPA